MRIAALLTANIVVNCIVIDDADDVSSLPGIFNVDEAYDVTYIDPMPGIDWTHFDGVWSPPPRPEPIGDYDQ